MGVIDEVLVGVLVCVGVLLAVDVDVSVVLPLIEPLSDVIEEYELNTDDEELGVLLGEPDDESEILELVVIRMDPETDAEEVEVGVMVV